jgi:glutamate decarboxylase
MSDQKRQKTTAAASNAGGGGGGGGALVSYTYATRYSVTDMPKYKMPSQGCPAPVAKQLILDERLLDSRPHLNLASFVTTWMEPEVIEIMKEALDVNYVDMMQYPSCTEIQNRCVSMLADLFHAEDREAKAVGTATIGSSEAIMLAGLALKFKWKKRMKKMGKSTEKPNLIMGYNVQVCWEKFCRYFEVEERFVHLEEGQYTLTPEKVLDLVDENTIGVAAILGSTYNGEFDDIKELNDQLMKQNAETGRDVQIHVDGASGAFVAPFIYPDLEWDFRLPLVCSINASGHKYGLVYPGIGWVVWKNKECLPEDLIFHTNYLGSDQPSITLNFSKGASNILAQYYTFMRLGYNGYKQIMSNLMKVRDYMIEQLMEMGHFKILSKEVGVPLVAFALTPGKDGKKRMYDEFQVSAKLRESGWTLPAYTMAPNASHVKLMRAVIREDMSQALADKLCEDIKRAIEYLDHHFTVTPEQVQKFKEEVIAEFVREPHAPAPVKNKFNGVC